MGVLSGISIISLGCASVKPCSLQSQLLDQGLAGFQELGIKSQGVASWYSAPVRMSSGAQAAAAAFSTDDVQDVIILDMTSA